MNSKISSGWIKVDKVLFRKESIKPGSCLRRFLGLEGQWSEKIKHIERFDDYIRIDYGMDDNVYLGEDLNNLIKKTQDKYGDKFTGVIVVSKQVGRRGFIDVTIEF